MDIEVLKAENQRLVEEKKILAEKSKMLSAQVDALQEERKQRKKLQEEKKQLQEKVAQLEFQLRELQRQLFSARRERYIPNKPDPKQLAFDFGELAPADVEAGADMEEEKVRVEYERRKKKHPGRIALPDHLPVEEIRIEPEEVPQDAEHVADTIVETLEYIPGSVLKRRYVFPRYVRQEKDEQGVERTAFFQGKMPARPLPKSIAEPGLLSHLITQKFVWHQPFYRQIQQFKALYEVRLKKSTVNDWFAATCTLIKPLYEKLKEKILQSDYLQADESPIQVQDDTKNGKTHRGYQWVYHDPLTKLLLFDYQKGRGKNGPKQILEAFSGVLQTDGYAVYDKLVKTRTDITLIGCMAHARRYFFEAKDSDPDAHMALEYFGKLYALERRIRQDKITDYETIAQLRQKHALPVLEAFFAWAREASARALPKSPFGKALFYLLQREEKLKGYCADGRLQIDNNLVENSIRPLALGRKNYLFAGSHPAAQRIAMMYSFFGSCRKQGVNPYKWLKTVLDRIAEHPINRIEELLPGDWVEKMDSDSDSA